MKNVFGLKSIMIFIAFQLLLVNSFVLHSRSGSITATQQPDLSTPVFLATSVNGADSSYVTNSNNGFQISDDTLILNRNSAYVENLMKNLENVLDQFVLTRQTTYHEQALNILELIGRHSLNSESLSKAKLMIEETGLSSWNKKVSGGNNDDTILGKTDEKERLKQAEQRKEWEEFRERQSDEVSLGGSSALNRREVNSTPSNFVGNELESATSKLLEDKKFLQSGLMEAPQLNKNSAYDGDDDNIVEASMIVSEYISKAGAANNFNGQSLGIGGLDDVLAQIKRRIWTPLAAPPALLKELGIQPVRGLLLYGKTGNGKTLLARTLGQILSPLRPLTIVSGPEIMDKFVGSSEQKLREIFDNPPDIYEQFKLLPNGLSLSQAALHVIIMDEFDAIARQRGGTGGTGSQGDAGVARDSVVNQLLAKMDGVAPLVVPTLVIGLTNRRSLVDSALLRPGRFEVQIEVPPPSTVEQRVSILNIHLRHMQRSGRLLVRDAPNYSAAASMTSDDSPTYQELLHNLASACVGFSAASLAGVARAAASHALERAVEEASQSPSHSILDCVVKMEDFTAAMDDIRNGLGNSDWNAEKESKERLPDTTNLTEST